MRNPISADKSSFSFFFNDMVGIYMHKNHLVHKYERRYCFVTFKIGKNDCSVKSAIQIRMDLNKHQYNTITSISFLQFSKLRPSKKEVGGKIYKNMYNKQKYWNNIYYIKMQ